MRFAFRESAFAIPMVLLNILFACTSHVVDSMPYPFSAVYQYVVWWFATLVGLRVQQFYDVASAVLLLAFAILAYFSFRKEGTRSAILSIVQWGSLGLTPLGVEILLFDRNEFYLAVTDFQVQHNFLVWFTNADMLFLAVGVFCGATMIKRFNKSL